MTTVSGNHDVRSAQPPWVGDSRCLGMTHRRGRAALKLLERQQQSYSFIQIHIKFT